MKTRQIQFRSPLQTLATLALPALLILAGTMAVRAQTPVVKADSYTSLATGSDWEGDVVPGTNNIAVWNSTAGAPIPEPLGASLSWAGIQVSNDVAGPIIINADANTLTLGEAGVVGLDGIDMSSANQSLTLSNNLTINGVQNWKIASGQTLNLDGLLSRNIGGAVSMYFNPATTTIYTTNGNDSVNDVDTTPNAMLGSTLGNIIFATINDTDYVAEVASGSGFDLVPGSTIAGLYTQNSTSTTPSDGQNETVMELVNPESVGDRLSSTRTYGALLFDTPQTNTVDGPNGGLGTWNGLPAWNVFIPSGRTLSMNSILVTTNEGNTPMLINNGAATGGSVGFLRMNPTETPEDFLIFQNDPYAPLIIQQNIQLEAKSGYVGTLVKTGAGPVQIQGSFSGTSAYTGGTLIYGGAIEIDGYGSVGTGPCDVYGGALAQSSTSTNYAPTTVFDGATNEVLGWVDNSQSLDTSTLTFNAGSTIQFVYSNTIAPSATTAALAVPTSGGLTLNGPVNVIALGPGIASAGAGVYPLISYSGTIGGSGFAALSSLTLPPHIYGYLSNDTADAYIDLVVTNVDQPIAWNTGNGVWDIGVTANWVDPSGNATTYQQVEGYGDNVAFHDEPSQSSITVTLNTNVTASSETVSNLNTAYTISGNGGMGGIGSFNKLDGGDLTLATINSFTGGINIDGGTVIFGALANLGAGPISFGGGTLQYNGNTDDISVNTVTLNAGGGTIDTAGSTITYANPIGNNGVGGLTKTGAGTLTLNGTNAYDGNTVVDDGTLALGASGFLPDSAAIIVNSGAVLDTATSGVNLELNSSVNQTLEGSGQVNGQVTAPGSTTILPAAAGVTGTLTINGDLTVAGGTVNVTLAASSNDVIAVTGSGNGDLTLTSGALDVNVIGTLPTGVYNLITYSGSLSGAPGNLTLTGYDFASENEAASLVAGSGVIQLEVVSVAHDNLAWTGSATGDWDITGTLDWLNGSTPWAYTNGDTVTFDDAGVATSLSTNVSLEAAVQPNLVTVNNTQQPVFAFQDGTGNGGGKIAATASVVKEGTGALVMATANTYSGATTIGAGTLQIGNGGIGDIGTGNVTNNGALVFAQGDGATHNVQGSISGTGSLTENATSGSAIVLEANNSYAGPTTISAGTLQVGTGGTNGSLGSYSIVTNNGALIFDVSSPMSFTYDVIGSGSLAFDGAGAVSLAGATLDYQGSTYISNAVVKVEANNQLPNANNVAGSTGDLNVDGGTTTAGTLDLNGFNVTVNAFSGQQNNLNGIITNSSTSTSTTNVLMTLQMVATTNNAQIMDHGAAGAKTELFVTGPGMLTLNPTNFSLFSGGIIVSNGSLGLGTPGDETQANPAENMLAPGAGPITLLGINGTNTIFYAGGALGSEVPTYSNLFNTLIIPAGQNVSVYVPQRGNIASAVTGSGVVNLLATYARSSVIGDWSAFTGQVVLSAPTAGDGNLGFGTNGFPNATLILTTNVLTYCGALSPYPYTGGAIVPIGALSGGDSSDEIAATSTGNAGGENTTFEIGGLNTNTTYSGGIVDGNSLLKVGAGTFTLNCGGVLVTNVALNGLFLETNVEYETNIVEYTGTTTVSNGTLALDAPVVLTNCWGVFLEGSNAVLDASDMGYISNLTSALPNGAMQELVINSTFEAGTNYLGGYGTLNGNLQADPGSIFDVGSSFTNSDGTNFLIPGTGTFNVTTNVSLSGTVIMNLDDTNASANSELAAQSFTINSTATLAVTNAGPGLVNGVKFTLFNHAVSGFASVALPATDPTGTTNYQWLNDLAVNGSITLTNGGLVVSPINPNPTNITFSVSSGNLTLSWPTDHTGWTLQSQTNSLGKGIGTNWVDVSGSTATNQVVVPVNPANPTVFYRLIYTP